MFRQINSKFSKSMSEINKIQNMKINHDQKKSIYIDRLNDI